MKPSQTAESTTHSEPSATTPVAQAVEVSAPAVHGGELWGGPRWIHNVTTTPVFVRTKQEYWDLLAKHGKQMKSMQESAVKSDVQEAPAPLPLHLQPTPEVAPLSKEDARLIAAMTPIFKRYGITEALYCNRCFTRQRDHGCRQRVSDAEVSIECRCGKAAYRPPMGTTDTVVSTLANYPVKELDRGMATIVVGDVASARPTVLLNSTEAFIIRSYFKFMRSRELEPRWFCRGCWDGRSLSETDSIGVKVEEKEIVLICNCRLIFDQKGKVH
jgi:hypothetical protein